MLGPITDPLLLLVIVRSPSPGTPPPTWRTCPAQGYRIQTGFTLESAPDKLRAEVAELGPQYRGSFAGSGPGFSGRQAPARTNRTPARAAEEAGPLAPLAGAFGRVPDRCATTGLENISRSRTRSCSSTSRIQPRRRIVRAERSGKPR